MQKPKVPNLIAPDGTDLRAHITRRDPEADYSCVGGPTPPGPATSSGEYVLDHVIGRLAPWSYQPV